MFICRYADNGRRGHGRVDPDADRVEPVRYDAGARRWVRAPGRVRALSEIVLLPPAEPGKVVCVALNSAADPVAAAAIRAHGPAGVPILLKPPNSLAATGDAVNHPGPGWELKHEAELAVVIAVPCKRVPASRAAAVVAGYTCANDLTGYATAGPDWPAGRPPVFAKHLDGSTPLGPWLVDDLDPRDVAISCRVDGELRQSGSTADSIWPVDEVVAHVSSHMTLLPGDVILTGTPAGSSALAVGARVEVSIAGIGTLHTVIDPPSGDLAAGHQERKDRAGL
ncbi:MAG: fumarylacetoacetate hydrolase family protein [Catenulispora sp.]